jgi:hypothetical protein
MRMRWAVVAAAVLVVGVSAVAAARPPSGTGRQLVERTVSVDTDPPGSDQLRINEVVQCPAGTASVSGGYRFDPPRTSSRSPSIPDGYRHTFGGPEGTNWRVLDYVLVEPTDSVGITLWAVCVNA